MSHMLYGTVWCFMTAHVNHVSSVNDSNSNSSISSSDSGSTDTSSNAKGSDSQQRMLASQCNSGGDIQPCVGLR